ncbi:MAG: EamA family transporter [Proteobacteria bacterium]|nr:EamA family transporter [Pseudomonadota bacterium]
MLGGILALLSAATFGLNNASIRRGVLTATVLQGLAITVPIGVPIFFVAALVSGGLAAIAGFSLNTYTLLIFAGLIHFVWGRYCNYRAIRAMGSNLAGPIQQSSLILTLSMAVMFLGETLTPLRIIGIALIILSPAVMLPSREERRKRAASPDHFQPKYLEGSIFAVLSATGFGSSPILIRAAMDGQSLSASVAGGLIAYGSAAVFIFFVFLVPGNLRHVTATPRNAAKWFTLSGIFVCTSQMLRFMALSLAPVSVVSPIQQTSSIFRILFSWVFNREHEVFSPGVLTAIFMSLLGALALTISTDFVIDLVPLPDGVVDIIRWQWP